ncbi:MAG TPA: hypothetical protein VGR93_05910 [Candidatus Acidoferrales bacterium]|nr:hypothetical protein [Candidatus Acidoferrales bacterium]
MASEGRGRWYPGIGFVAELLELMIVERVIGTVRDPPPLQAWRMTNLPNKYRDANRLS